MEVGFQSETDMSSLGLDLLGFSGEKKKKQIHTYKDKIPCQTHLEGERKL